MPSAFAMSTPSENTRSRTPTPSVEIMPSTAQQSKLSAEFASVAIRDSPGADPNKASSLRKELLAILENPQADKEDAVRKDFCAKFLRCAEAGALAKDDVLYRIAEHVFGMKTYKLVLIGSAGVGKTSFVAKQKRNQFVQKYVPTHGAEVTPIVRMTDRGDLIKFDVWDTAGVEKHGKLRDGYYVGADCGIIMYDVSSKESYKALFGFHKDLVRVCDEPNIPIVCVGNKGDIKVKDRSIKPKQVTFPRKKRLDHKVMSNKSGQNSDQPLLHLARQLEGDKCLRFFVTGQHFGDGSEVEAATEVAEAARLSLPAPKDSDGGL